MFEHGKRWTKEEYEAPPNFGARQLCAVVVERFREREHADLRLAEAINEWDTAAGWSADGACSAPSWLRAQLGVRHGSAVQLDVGRKTRVIPTGLRTAVEQRDRCCREPGCDTPAWFSEVHHIIHWADGGTTTRSNCCLFCRKHHKMIHHGWTVTGDANATLTFTAPDGTLYYSHPPG